MPSLSKTIALLFLFIGTCSAFNEMSLQSLHIRELLTVVSIGDVYVVTVDLLYNKCSHRHRFFFRSQRLSFIGPSANQTKS